MVLCLKTISLILDPRIRIEKLHSSIKFFISAKCIPLFELSGKVYFITKISFT